MNKHWKIIVALFVIVAILGAIGWQASQFFGRVLYGVYAQSGDLERMANEAATTIVAEWNPRAIKPYATEEYFTAQQEEGSAAWQTYAELGTPNTLKPCVATSLHVTNVRGEAVLDCPVTFPAGDGELNFDYNNDSGEWKIVAFKVSLKPAT